MDSESPSAQECNLEYQNGRGIKVDSTTTNVNNDLTPRPAKHDDTTYLAVVVVAVIGADGWQSEMEDLVSNQ